MSSNTLERRIAANARDRVHVSETAAGTWIVRDDADRRGGWFQDRRAAFRFIRDEFGRDAEILPRPPLVTPAADRLSNAHQRRMARPSHRAR